MPAPAHPAHGAALVARQQRQVAAQTGHQHREEGEPEPPPGPVSVRIGAGARVGRVVTLRVGHAVVEEALGGGQAGDALHALAAAVGGRVRAPAARVEGEAERLPAVNARLLLLLLKGRAVVLQLLAGVVGRVQGDAIAAAGYCS